MFYLLSAPLDPEVFRLQMLHPADGAWVAFEGRVRNHNLGKAVLRLEYEAYEALARKEGERILAEARDQYGLERIFCAHRIGLLEIGDIAVCVGAASSHRKQAFLACSFIIDEVKKRVPVWKKEHYAEEDAQWVLCPSCAHAGATSLL